MSSDESKEFKSLIYTRTGDDGTSGLYTGHRRKKTDIVFEALGHVDELNSTIGCARQFCIEANNGLAPFLEEIQQSLFNVGSNIGTPRNLANEIKIKRTEFDADGNCLQRLEHWIDKLDVQLPPLKTFILPSGGRAASFLHLCRSACRRAERATVALQEVPEVACDVSCVKYLNRLSDFFFVAARFASRFEGTAEVMWDKNRGTTPITIPILPKQEE
eukprot:Colp12_sorted_trinity150504_noHs@34014